MKNVDKKDFLNKLITNLSNNNYSPLSSSFKELDNEKKFSFEGMMLETLRKDFNFGTWRGKAFHFDNSHSVANTLTIKDIKDLGFSKKDYHFFEKMKKSTGDGLTFPKVANKVKSYLETDNF